MEETQGRLSCPGLWEGIFHWGLLVSLALRFPLLPLPGVTSCPHSWATWLSLRWIWAEQECLLEHPQPRPGDPSSFAVGFQVLETITGWYSHCWSDAKLPPPALQLWSLLCSSALRKPLKWGEQRKYCHNLSADPLHPAPPPPVLWLHTLSAAICVNNLSFPASPYPPWSPTPMLLGSLQW